MIKILGFFAKDNTTSEMTTVTTDFENYKYTRIINGQIVEEITNKGITVITAYYQIDLSNAIESKKQVIIL